MTPRVALPRSLAEAVAALEGPPAQLLAGGTDFMVEVNFGHRRPERVVSLRRVADLRGYALENGHLVLRAGLTYREMEAELGELLPALAQAARTVGSPQIRNAGTLGGNLGTASPAGDTLPVLAALDAEVELVGPAGPRRLPLDAFLVGPKRTALRPDEVIRHVRLARLRGPQEFLKVGPRNAMAIAIASCALVLDLDGRSVRCALGSVGPVPIRAREAEAFIATALDWRGPTASAEAMDLFADLVAAAARPITDHRGTAEYRRQAVRVLARRALERSLAGVR